MQSAHTLNIPIVSLRHIPSREHLKELLTTKTHAVQNTNNDVYFVYLEPTRHAWLKPLIEWIDSCDETNSYWVRFCSSGDIIEGLPVYSWN